MPRELVIRWAPIPGTAQESFFDDDTPDADIALFGGYGAGKTISLTGKALKLSAINAPVMGVWVVPDYQHIFDTILPTLSSRDPETGDPWFLDGNQYSFHGQRHVLTWEGGGPIHFLTAENPDSIAGPNVAFAVMDEPGKVKQAAWRNTVARVRHPGAKLRQRCVAGTPEGLNWLADHFGPDRAENCHVYYMQTAQNAEMLKYNPGFLEQVRANATEAELAAYLEGRFVNMAGALAYAAFDPARQMRPVELNPHLPLRIAFDFNVDPMTAVIGQQWAGPAGVEFGVHTALALSASTVMQICGEIVTRWPEWGAGVVVYGDATGKSRSHQSLKSNYDIITALLGQMGRVTLNVPMANPPVARRLNSVNRLCLDARGVCRLWINGDAQAPRKSPARELVRSLQQTAKKPGTDDIWKKTGETVSHLSDALGYWLDYEAPAQVPELVAASIKAPARQADVSETMRRLKLEKSRRLAEQLAQGAA